MQLNKINKSINRNEIFTFFSHKIIKINIVSKEREREKINNK